MCPINDLPSDTKVSTRIGQSLTLSDWLFAGEIDIAVFQVLRDEVRRGDIVLYEDQLHWIKSHDLPLKPNAPVPFLSFDQNCFYKHRAQSQATLEGRHFEVVLECPSVSGVFSATRTVLGVALINGLHETSDLDVVEDVFPKPPAIAYVARAIPKAEVTQRALCSPRSLLILDVPQRGGLLSQIGGAPKRCWLQRPMIQVCVLQSLSRSLTINAPAQTMRRFAADLGQG